jgi:cytochrome c oxidase subunit 4
MNRTNSTSTYFTVWAALMVLLFATWGVAQFDLGILNPIAAVTIAVIKMLLVILFFMQVRHHSRLTKLFAGAGFVWLLIMITLTMTDYLSRKVVKPYEGEILPQIEKQTTVPTQLQGAGR